MTKLSMLISVLLSFAFCTKHVEPPPHSNTSPDPNSITREASTGVREEFDNIGNVMGLIALNERRYGKEDFIHFFNEDGSLWYKFTYYYDESDGKFEYANDDFRPFAFHIDYFLLALKCVGKEKGRYEVIVNEETGLRKYVKADDPTLKFQTWEEHLLHVFAINFNREDNPVLESPQGQVKNAALSDKSLFHPVEVKEEWLKVNWDPAYKAGNKGPQSATGWIRWKKGERLLVELFYFA